MTTDNDAYAKKNDPGGFTRTCQNPDCPSGFTFKTANPRSRYCCDECQKSAQNRRNYARRKAKKEGKGPVWPASRHGATHGWNWAHLLDEG